MNTENQCMDKPSKQLPKRPFKPIDEVYKTEPGKKDDTPSDIDTLKDENGDWRQLL